MRIFGSIVLAGALSVAVVPEIGQTMEVIKVRGCAPGWILIDHGGGEWGCYADFSDLPGGGGIDPIGGDDDPVGGGGGGGGSEPVRQNGWDDLTWEQFKKDWRCNQCQGALAVCVDRAKREEMRCVNNAEEMAQFRCNPAERGEDKTVTPWGCTLWLHKQGLCEGVGPEWNHSGSWDYTCKTKLGGTTRDSNGKMSCSGMGLATCDAAWATSHPGGVVSSEKIDSASYSTSFEVTGGSGGYSKNNSGSTTTKITVEYVMSAATGYLMACTTVGNKLASGCNEELDKCYAARGCSK